MSILFLVFSCSIFSQLKAIILCSISFVTTHASHPYSRIQKIHICSTLFFVSISIDVLFQTFSMAFSAAVAFASLVRTSLMLSRSYVVLLPRYVNCSTLNLKKNIMQKLTGRKLELFGHIKLCRMHNDRKIKELMFERMEGTNKRGRSHREWLDDIIKWGGMSLQKLSQMASDRGSWRKLMKLV